jgi:alkanesulfonate monooxygenase SsuD/methylene tetrahydromethanopterin reductase-like flavin-dependent oxidoreductase (luciferase family)
MRYGFVMSAGSAREFADAAVLAERSGWDAIFTFEVVWGQDAWVTLAAAAMQTERIRLGTMLTPLPRIRPWDLAGRVATVDDLSAGRVQLAVGLGALHENWLAFEADEGRRVRAEKLDEGLAVYDGLMRGQPFSFSGKHYQVSPTTLMTPPPPVQKPRVPVWVVGAHPSAKSLGRAAQWDGLIPQIVGIGPEDRVTPDQLGDVVTRVRELREESGLAWDGYDIVVEGTTRPDPDDVTHVSEFAAAGATWWIESDWSVGEDRLQQLRKRIEAGPPR